MQIHVVNSTIGLHDLLMFAPQLDEQALFHRYSNGRLQVDATVTGYLNNIDIGHLYAAGLDNTEILLTGHLSGIPEPKDLSYDLNITKFQSSPKRHLITCS